MAAPIRFYFDFASPYAYFARAGIAAIGEEFGLVIEPRPILMWAVLKAHGIVPPMDAPVKRSYLVHDMQRSAAFFGVPYVHPAKLPLSSHLATRLYYAAGSQKPDLAERLARRLFTAFFAEQADISDEATLIRLAGEVGVPAEQALDGMKGPAGRAMLEGAVAEAIAAGVVGSPYFLIDDEGFFGADRLPQLRWHLSRGRA